MPIDPKTIRWDDQPATPQGIVWDDEPPQQSQQPATNTVGQEAGRQAGLTVRHLVNAAASPLVIGGDIIGKGINAVTGRETVKPYGPILNRALTSLGLPEAERPIERFTQGMAESAPSVALPASLPAQVLGNAAISAAQAEPGEELSQAAYGAAGGAAVPVLGKALQLLGRGAAQALGGTTGAGAESVRQAYRNAPGFVENMRGKVEPSEVVDQARSGIQTMRQQMQDGYRADKTVWSAGQKTLPFDSIMNAYAKLTASLGHEGFGKVGPAEQRVINEINDVLTEFGTNPKWHTTEGFDALKQRLQAIYPENPQMRQAQRAVSTMADAVKSTIIEKNPQYADAMSRYWNASRELDEIERTLSLGNKATTDTALRKLQSLMRNNVSANYGQRLKLAGRLATQSGEDVLPAVAGQAMNDWLPRGISRGVGAAVIPPALLSGGLGIPAAIGSAAIQSPRLVGEAARWSGMAANSDPVVATIQALRRMTPATLRNLNNDGK